MKRLFLTVIFIATLHPSIIYAASATLTLDEAVERGLAANRDIQVTRQRLAEIEGLKGEARAMGLPQLTATGSYQRLWRKPEIFINGQVFSTGADNTYTVGGEISQLLWDGGKVLKAVKAARSEEAKGIQDVRDAEEQVRLAVKQTFYQILYTEKVIDVLKKQLAQLKGHLSSIRARYEKGIDSDYALMRQEVEVSNIEPHLIEAQKVLELLKNGMKILLAIPADEDIALKGRYEYIQGSLPDAETMIEKGRATRPDLLAQKFREKSLVQNVGVEKAGWWPTLNATASWNWQGQSNDWRLGSNEMTDYAITAINLSWPIFDGLKTSSRVKQAKARLLQQRFQTSQLEDSVIKEVRDAIISLQKAQAALKSQSGAYNTARRATAIAAERFETGLMSQLELNDTITAQAQAEQLYYGAIYECLSAEAVLEKAIGGAM